MEDIKILETPDNPKTIEEINAENLPKVISKPSSKLKSSEESSMQDKLEFFKKLYSKKSDHEYSWERKIFNRDEKLKLIESEIAEIDDEIKQFSKDSDDYKNSFNEIQEIREKINIIKEKSAKSKDSHPRVKLQLPKSQFFTEEKFSSGIQFEVDISNFDKQRRMVDVQNKVTVLENIIGKWTEKLPISESLSLMLKSTYFFNENILEKIKEQASHLGNELDSMASNSNQAQASFETVQKIERLYDELYDKVISGKNIPEIVKKLKTYQAVFLQSINVETSLQSIEKTNQVIDNRITESVESIKEIKVGIAENKKTVNQSISMLNKKLAKI